MIRAIKPSNFNITGKWCRPERGLNLVSDKPLQWSLGRNSPQIEMFVYYSLLWYIVNMKDLNEELSVLLRTAEESVLDIVARAAAQRDYTMLDKARSVAERLRALEAAEQPRPTAELAKRKRRTSGKGKPRNLARGDYPKFTVTNGSLYKIGWSKKKNNEYTHRITIERVHEVIGALDQLSQKVSGVVSGEDILESGEMQMAHVPSYQVYLVLALLKREKIINSAGRDGYRLPDGIFPQADSLLHSLEGK